MACGVVITVMVLAKTGLNLFDRSAALRSTPRASAFLKPGLMHVDAINGISFGLAFLLGTAGLPHILIRFFTVPDAQRGAPLGRLGGAADRPLLRDDHGHRRGRAGDPRRRRRGGERGRQPGHPAARRGARRRRRDGRRRRPAGRGQRDRLRDDPRRRGRAGDLGLRRDGARPVVERRPARARPTSATRCAWRASRRSVSACWPSAWRSPAGEGFNVSILVGLAFAVAASANLPALLCALFWPRFNTAGAVDGRARRSRRLADPDRAQPGRVAGAGRRGLAGRRSPTRRCSRSRSASSAAGWGRC